MAKKRTKSTPRPPLIDREKLAERLARVKAARHHVQNALGVAALAALAFAGYRASSDYVTAHAAPDVAPEIVIADPPAWIEPVLGDVVAGVGAIPPTPPTDADTLRAVSARLAGDPWVKQVNRVRRVTTEAGEQQIVAECVFRVPAVLVEGGDGYFVLVDTEGVRLPRRFGADQLRRFAYDAAGGVQVRRVTGVRADAPAVGDAWPGDDLAAGLALAAYLENETFSRDIEAIDVSNYRGRVDGVDAHLHLLTRHGSVIRWGRGVGEEDTIAWADADMKRAYLRVLWEEHGRLDLHKRWIDIRRRDRILHSNDVLADVR